MKHKSSNKKLFSLKIVKSDENLLSVDCTPQDLFTKKTIDMLTTVSRPLKVISMVQSSANMYLSQLKSNYSQLSHNPYLLVMPGSITLNT